MEEPILYQVWKTVRVEAGPQPFQGYYSIGDSMLFDFRFLDNPEQSRPEYPLGSWTRHAEKIKHPGNEATLYLLVQVVTEDYLVLELHMVYAGQPRHTLTLSLVPNRAEVTAA
ncbi:hypothetical protein MUN84_10690 [Hymenobacter sp. 5516J-16]|uniref:hypothetical protein n=1 Tax=Hymenobacter sp. 5516J-16 TaxID=2932253 RepID=UPI001FD5A79F|nr:hypothetical protein [Hymenobacter sp. 5516J-16]UOQ78942.1 hypothetical protein MUN84_10690 [Hymenobacter sp. 5516J-16]